MRDVHVRVCVRVPAPIRRLYAKTYQGSELHSLRQERLSGGHVEEWISSQGLCVTQYGDEPEYTVFHRCPICKTVYQGFVEYMGRLTPEQLEKYVPESRGRWHDWDEDEVIAKEDPASLVIQKRVDSERTRYGERGKIEVPIGLKGCLVEIRVVKVPEKR